MIFLTNFISIYSKLLKNFIYTCFPLIEDYEQGALRKELFIAPLVERFNTPTLGKCYWYILPAIETIFLNIAFLPIFGC